MERIKKLYGIKPRVFTADKGFCPRKPMYNELENHVGTLSIPRRMRDFGGCHAQRVANYQCRNRSHDTRVETRISACKVQVPWVQDLQSSCKVWDRCPQFIGIGANSGVVFLMKKPFTDKQVQKRTASRPENSIRNLNFELPAWITLSKNRRHN